MTKTRQEPDSEGRHPRGPAGTPPHPATRATAAGLRTPGPEDAAGVWQLVRDAGSLDLNSPYAYLLLCSDFRDTGVVAADPRRAGGIGGFVLGYRRPPSLDTWFVWQVAVAPEQRGRGLAGRMLGWVMARHPDVRFLEATVTPSNAASRALFEGFARRHGLGWHEQVAFPAHWFPAGDHEEEIRIRIGPRDGALAPARQEERA